MDEEMVAKVHDFESSDLPEATKLALRFTERWVAAHAQGIDGVLLELMREYYTDVQIVEIALIVGRYDTAHRFNVAFGLERALDDYYTFGDAKIPKLLEGALETLREAHRERVAREG
ncbi:MAG: hypothetical protein F4Z25_12720 [Chloroflexi bacterium]|nr:hypothetical protein [Chloroflexota bacterium]